MKSQATDVVLEWFIQKFDSSQTADYEIVLRPVIVSEVNSILCFHAMDG